MYSLYFLSICFIRCNGDPCPAAWPGPGLCLEPASRIFFTLAYFFTFRAPPPPSPCPGLPGPGPGPGPTLYAQQAFRIFFTFPYFFHFWALSEGIAMPAACRPARPRPNTLYAQQAFRIFHFWVLQTYANIMNLRGVWKPTPRPTQ